jgi:hypothetical protein
MSTGFDGLDATEKAGIGAALRAGVKARNGQIVLAGAEACARDLGRKQQWDKWARGCSALEFVQIARVELELGKVYCDRYSQ